MRAMTNYCGWVMLSGRTASPIHNSFFIYDIRLQVHLIDQGQGEQEEEADADDGDDGVEQGGADQAAAQAQALEEVGQGEAAQRGDEQREAEAQTDGDAERK